MNTRIKLLRKKLGLTQDKFAEKIGCKRNTVATWENSSEPNQAFQRLICKEFNVNPEWLEKGEGEMFITPTGVDEELVSWIESLLTYDDDNIKKRFARALAQLNDEQWKLVEDMARKLLDEQNKSKSDGHPDTPEELEKLYPPVDIKNKDVC